MSSYTILGRDPYTMTAEIYRNTTIAAATIENTGAVVLVQDTSLQLGEPRVTGIRTFIRNTYPASYNHVARNMNHLTDQANRKTKRHMRGGHLFLYRPVISLAILLCFCFGIVSIFAKPCATIPFVLSVLYIVLSIYNIVIFFLNRPLINRYLTKQVPRGTITGGFMNEFYSVPVNATVFTGVMAIFIDPLFIADAVREEGIEVAEITIMFYDDRYLACCRFPKEIIGHLIIFIILFIFAIGCVSAGK